MDGARYTFETITNLSYYPVSCAIAITAQCRFCNPWAQICGLSKLGAAKQCRIQLLLPHLYAIYYHQVTLDVTQPSPLCFFFEIFPSVDASHNICA